ncbi:MAG TPA: sigma-54 dependent transcriptional regulator [Planctomycetota bacterium]|nr:sigma-54 dependent transcriptional regulator [Planctomycetota bacterium]
MSASIDVRGTEIVLIDDEQHILDIQRDALAQAGIPSRSFQSPIAAWDYISSNKITLVVTDWNMPGMTGMELLFKTRALPQPPHVIIVTGHGTVHRAVSALNTGAFDFIEKPFEIAHLVRVVREAVASHRAAASAVLTKTKPPRPATGRVRSNIIVVAPAMQSVYERAVAAAQADSSVLLLGESGCGKEVLADCIHSNSRRAAAPLIKVNCGALPEHLMESELFGHEKGSFTGADRRHIGRFEQANGGTLFLDEIGDLLLPLQVKLLRAIQNRTIERVGSSTPISVDFRLICATHRDLTKAIAAGNFREDLYYRINVIPIQIPSLRERQEDIKPLALHFFNKTREELGSGPVEISPEALDCLQRYSWPGNVRQLRNAIEYALVLCKDSAIGPKDLPEDVHSGRAIVYSMPEQQAAQVVTPVPPPIPTEPARSEPADMIQRRGFKDSIKEAEAELIRAALSRNYWRITATARELGLSRATLYVRMQLYNIRRPK